MFKAGTASETITPTEPLWLAGYASRTQPAREKISDLSASALAIEDKEGSRLIIASIDLIAITPIISDRVYAAVQSRTGLDRQHLILAASHTHYGPEFRPDKALFFNIPENDAKRLESVAVRIADALSRVVVRSLDSFEPVNLFARKTRASFAHNRRREGVKGGAPSPEDTLDQDVPILDVVRADGSRKAIVFGYACHNTTIAPEDCRYCADWAGFAKTELVRADPNATALFVAGCGADQNPEPRGTVALSQKYGREIASAILKCVEHDEAIELTGAIRVAREDAAIRLEPVSREKIDAMLASDDKPQNVKAQFLFDQLARGESLITSYPVPVHAARIGDDFLLIALGGEPVVDWAMNLKREFADRAEFIWVAGYCNDMFGYLPTRRIQNEGGYEGGRANLWSWIPAPFTHDVEDRVTEAARRLVDEISR